MLDKAVNLEFVNGQFLRQKWFFRGGGQVLKSKAPQKYPSFEFDSTKPTYLYSSSKRTAFNLLRRGAGSKVRGSRYIVVDSDLELTGNATARLVVMEFDSSGSRIGEVWIEPNKTAQITLADGASRVLVAIRFAGFGLGEVRSIMVAPAKRGVQFHQRLVYPEPEFFKLPEVRINSLESRLERAGNLLESLQMDLEDLSSITAHFSSTANSEIDVARNLIQQSEIDLLSNTGIFDKKYYELVSGNNFENVLAAIEHFIAVGMRRKLSCNFLLDVSYLPANIQNEWAAADVTSVVKYLKGKRGNLTQLGRFFDVSLCDREAWKNHPGGPLGWFISRANAEDKVPTKQAQLEWGPFQTALNEGLSDINMRQWELRGGTSSEWDFQAEADFKARLSDQGPLEDEPLVSVIMPVWNRKAQLESAIGSIHNQSYSNIELLVVDDGSKDGSSLEAGRIIQNLNLHAQVIERPHEGVCAARNAGAKVASGKYLAFLDSDNQWTPDFIEMMVRESERTSANFLYAGQALMGSHGVRYRGSQLNRRDLLIRNGIDLNVILIKTALFREVGGFDESLKRWVDHDLVIRLTMLSDPVYVPIIGCFYEDRGLSRISTTEPDSWQWVVLSKYWLDWDAAEQGLLDRVAGRVSVIIPMLGQIDLTRQAVNAVLRSTRGHDVEVILVDNGSSTDENLSIRGYFSRESRVKILRLPRNLNFAIGSNYGVIHSSGSLILFLNNDTIVRGNWLEPLLDTLSSPEVVGVQPLLLFDDDSIQSSGTVFLAENAVPNAFLVGHPREEALKVRGEKFHAVTAAALLISAEDVVDLRGFDAHFVNGMEDVDFCLRAIKNGRHFEVVPDSIVTHLESRTPGRGKYILANRQTFMRRWKGKLPTNDGRLYQKAGFQISQLCSDGNLIPGSRPKLSRVPGQAPRWGIRFSANGGPRGDVWGDTYFVESLSHALGNLGNECVTYRHGANVEFETCFDEVNLVIRGIDSCPPIPGCVNVLWVISHPETVTIEEVRAFDLVYAASKSWAEEMTSASGRLVRPLLQATDASRFYPDYKKDSEKLRDAVFVGSIHRGRTRRIVNDSRQAGVDFTVIGGGWDGLLPDQIIESDRIGNEQLRHVYATSRRVFADHWPEMADAGFMQNRLFDAVACGARVISDDVEGIEEIFKGAVQTYATLDELSYLCSREGDSAFPDDNEMYEIAKGVLEQHTFDARANRLIQDVDEYRRRNI